MKSLHKALLTGLIFSTLCLAVAFTSVERRSVATPRFGVCSISTIPVRATASHKSEIVTQMLFGEAYTVIEETWDSEWFYVRMNDDQYEGWVPASQFSEVSTAYYMRYREAKHAVQQSPISKIHHPELGSIFVSIGSVLPFYENGKVNIGDQHFTVEKVDGDVSAQASPNGELLNTAYKYMHAPYLWGGKSIFGIDCSGFVQQVFKSAKGISLPRDSYQQAEFGETVAWQDAKAGDLAFFQNAKGRIIHVGILLNGQEIIHASGKVRVDKFTPEGIYSAEQGKHTHKLAYVKRM